MEPVYFVMEYMPNGSLLDFLRQDSGQLVKLPVIVKMAAQISDGMAYLEAKTIPHLDLRAANVLLGQHYDVKVTDMAMKRIFNEDPFTPTDFKIPLRWMAPEALMYARFTVKSDVWSFGVLLYELNSRGATPYVSLTGRDFVKRVTEGYRLPRPQGCPEPFYEMMTRCWHAEPSQRPTFEYLHSFFGDYNVSTEEKYRQIETEAT